MRGAVFELVHLKILLIVMKHMMWPLALTIGITVLPTVSSGAVGFNFLGIIAIVVGVMLLILFCIDCATFDNSEEVFLFESIFCGVPLYFLMVGLGIFALAVSVPGKGRSLPGIAYKEYDLKSYSNWMQNKVNDTYRWEKYYKSRLIKYHVCQDMTSKYRLDTIDMFYKRSLNSFESGCCKPPEACKFNYTSPTNWTKPENQTNSNMDCYTWSNDPTTFCYNCQSCKAGFVHDVIHHWRIPVAITIVVLFKLVLGTLIFALVFCCNPDMFEAFKLKPKDHDQDSRRSRLSHLL